MRKNREQLKKIMGLMGEGSTRRIRLTVFAFLVVSGIVLQGLAWWYGVQMTTEKWDEAAVQVWPFAIGIWILIVGLAVARLWRCLKEMQEGSDLGGQAPST